MTMTAIVTECGSTIQLDLVTELGVQTSYPEPDQLPVILNSLPLDRIEYDSIDNE